MKIKTQDLTGAALDWAVAKCVGHLDAGRVVVDLRYMSGEDPVRWEPQLSTYYSSAYNPSTNWAQGGPIIEREGITVQTDPTDAIPDAWSAYFRGALFNDDGTDFFRNGPTPLIAAMRCFVASKLGDEVDVPEELV